MKITINKKMDKSVAARGRIVKLLIPRAGMTYFKVGNAVLDKLLTGRKLKKYFTDEVHIERGDGTAIRTLLYSRRGVKETEEFTSTHPNAGSKAESERKKAERAKAKSGNKSAGSAAKVVGKSSANKSSRPAFLWIHGGGYAMGIPEQEFYFINRILEAIDAVVISPEYTRSVDAPYPKALEDCYCALKWLKENAEDLGADPDRIFVGGDSAGGGLTAAISLYARDKGEVKIVNVIIGKLTHERLCDLLRFYLRDRNDARFEFLPHRLERADLFAVFGNDVKIFVERQNYVRRAFIRIQLDFVDRIFVFGTIDDRRRAVKFISFCGRCVSELRIVDDFVRFRAESRAVCGHNRYEREQ